MLFGVYFLLLAGAGIAAPNPVKVVMSTEVSAIRLGHAAANARPPLGPGGQPTKMRHLCKDMQQAVQNTAIRLLTFIGISGPSLSGTTPVSEGRFSGVRVTYHKIFPVPVIDPVFALEESRLHPDGTVMHHHEVHRFHKDGQPGGPFLNRVHHALMSLGPWEGRIVAFVLGCGIGVLLRMAWVLAVLLVRGARGAPEREETILVCAEEAVPIYTEIEEKQVSHATSKD